MLFFPYLKFLASWSVLQKIHVSFLQVGHIHKASINFFMYSWKTTSSSITYISHMENVLEASYAPNTVVNIIDNMVSLSGLVRDTK